MEISQGNFFLLQNMRTGEQKRFCLGGLFVPVGVGRMWRKGVGG
jgi:hypothetical protein